MRSDMGKVVVERPRRGSGNPNIKSKMKFRGPNIDLDKVDETVSTNKIGHKTLRGHKIGYNRKELNEHLNPLKKYIRTNCGRPWNDVFSEICKTVPVNSILGHHIINDHLYQYVEVNTIMKDGDVYCVENGREYKAKDHTYSRWGAVAYVHPVTGILTRYKKPKNLRTYLNPTENEKELNFLKIADGHEYRKIDGIWFEFKYRYDPGDNLVEVRYVERYHQRNPDGTKSDVYGVKLVPAKHQKWFQHWVDPKKRSLSKKEIKALKPENLGNYDHYLRVRKFIPQKHLAKYK